MSQKNQTDETDRIDRTNQHTLQNGCCSVEFAASDWG